MYKGYKPRGVFLDMPKVFDKECHEGIVFKLNLLTKYFRIFSMK